MIVNGIIKDKYINGLKVNVDIIKSKGIANVRTLRPMKPLGLTIHNTGNSGKNSGDENHALYLQNVENADSAYVSWHITVDENSMTQHLPFNECGYHAGDGANGYGNSKTIGIEIAEASNQNYAKCEENAIKVIRYLMKEYGFKIENIQPHRKYSSIRKLCPWRILKTEKDWQKNWKAFQDRIVNNEPMQSSGKKYTVQVGAFSNKQNAERYCKELNVKGIQAFVKEV